MSTKATKAGPGLVQTSALKGPAEDPEAWNFLCIENTVIAAKCLLPDFERERDVDAPKKKGSDRNVLIDNGMKPGEVTIQIQTTDDEQLRLLQDAFNRYMSPDRPLTRQNVVRIGLPGLNERGIRQLYFHGVGGMKAKGEGQTALLHTFKAKVFDAKTRIGGDGKSSKPKPTTGVGGATDPIFYSTSLPQNAQNLFATYTAPPWVTTPDSQPQNSTPAPPRLYDPLSMQSMANGTGSKSATFVNDATFAQVPAR